MRRDPFHTHSPSLPRPLRRRDGWTLPLVFGVLLVSGGVSGSEHEPSPQPRFLCTPLPPDAPCLPSDNGGHHSSQHTEHQDEHPGRHHGAHHTGYHGDSLWGVSDEATPTILHLRESLVQQKEMILDQRETIRELTAKLALCQGFGHGLGGHEHGHGPAHYRHHRGNEKHTGDETTSPSHSSSPEQMSRMLATLKDRLENLQTQNTSTTYSASLKELLQRKISALEQQMLHHAASITDGDDEDEGHDDDRHDGHHHDEHHDGQHDGDNDHHDGRNHDSEAGGHGHPRTSYLSQDRRTAHGELDKVLKQLTHARSDAGARKRSKSSRSFQIGFSMRTNYMYGRVKRTLMREIFAMTLCVWLKGGASSIGTPFSYSAPGQANELVLIEWRDKPMELLIKDTAVILPLSLHDGKWHHVCVTWSARDGVWEVYQDGTKRGSGENLNAWQPIKPGGVFILGQEQDSLGGRFDATQAFVGEISDLQLWSHTLAHNDIYSLASCRGQMTGDIISWAESVVELHGGVTKYPFDPCH